jgi:hypothetical protein
MNVNILRQELEHARNEALALVEQLKVHTTHAEALSLRITRIIRQLDEPLEKSPKDDNSARRGRK